MASKKSNRFNRGAGTEKRLDKIEKYLETFGDKVEGVAEDNDNLRFMISLVRRQEKVLMDMNNNMQQQIATVQKIREFLETKGLMDELKEYMVPSIPEPPTEDAPPEEEGVPEPPEEEDVKEESE